MFTLAPALTNSTFLYATSLSSAAVPLPPDATLIHRQAVWELQGAIESQNHVSLAFAVPRIGAIAQELEQSDADEDKVQAAQILHTLLKTQYDENPEASIPSDKLLAELRQDSIIPEPTAESRAEASRYQQGIQRNTLLFGGPYPKLQRQTGLRFFDSEVPVEEAAERLAESVAVSLDEGVLKATTSDLTGFITRRALTAEGNTVTIQTEYKRTTVLGQGGMGVVYRARDMQLDRDVAIKMMHVQATDDRPDKEELRQEFIERFRNEARLQGGIETETIVRAYVTAVQGDGDPYLVMEMLKGSLGKIIDETNSGRRAFNLEEAVRFARQAAESLADVHARGLIHRDIKPDNFFISEKGRLKLGDFGIAISSKDVEQEDHSRVAGSPEYIAPECWEHRPDSFKRDVYALGAMLYEIFTGELPFSFNDLEPGQDPMRFIMMKSMTTDFEPVHLRAIDRQIPEALSNIISRALTKDPEERPTAHELLVSLLTFEAEVDLNVSAAMKHLNGREIEKSTEGGKSALATSWLDLLKNAAIGFKHAYDIVHSESIKDRIIEIFEEIAQWADTVGNDPERTAAIRELRRYDPDNFVAHELSQNIPVRIRYSTQSGLPLRVFADDEEFRVTLGRFTDEGGVLKWDGVKKTYPSPIKTLPLLPRGGNHQLRVDHPSLHSVAIPLPARPSSVAHVVRVPLYLKGETRLPGALKLPDDFIIIPAGHVASNIPGGRHSRQLPDEESWKPISYDYAMGPKVTNQQYLDYIIDEYAAVLEENDDIGEAGDNNFIDMALVAVGKRIPSHWNPRIRDKLARGLDLAASDYIDVDGRPLDLGAAVTGITYPNALKYLDVTYREHNKFNRENGYETRARPATLHEWKRAVRGNDVRMFPWGDRIISGVADWRFTGDFSQARIRANHDIYTDTRLGDWSPFSLMKQNGLERGIGFLVSGTRTMLSMDPEYVGAILEASGRLQHIDPNDKNQLAQVVFTVGGAYNAGPPSTIEIVTPYRVQDMAIMEETGFFPVIRLNTSKTGPTPKWETLTQ